MLFLRQFKVYVQITFHRLASDAMFLLHAGYEEYSLLGFNLKSAL